MHNFYQDFRYSLRRIKNDPGFAIVAVLTLALGIGANSAIFSIVNAVLLRPLPYRNPQSVVLVLEKSRQLPKSSASYLNFKDWREQSQSFEAMGAVRNTTSTLTGSGEPERVAAQMATANLFELLGIQPEIGRPFLPEEDRAGGTNVVLISHGLWQRRFSGSQQVLGQAVTIDDKSYTIVGVLAPNYQILQTSPDVVVPMEPWARTLPDDRAWHPGILPIARLKPGVSVQQANSEMQQIAKRLEQQYPVYDTGTSAQVIPMQEQMVENVRPALLMLMGAVGFVLLIACTNVANLLIARAAARQREIAVRTAIGASRSRIIRQLVTESVLLSLAGGILGLLMAWAAMPPLLHLAGSALPGSSHVSVDLSVLLFTMVVALAGGILFGLAPARHAWRIDVREALNETDRGAVSSGVLKLRGALVVAEVATAMLLLVGAGLLLRSFERLSTVAPGFATDHILVADIPLSPNAHRTSTERLDFFNNMLDHASTLPGVRSAAAASFLPVSGGGGALYFNIQGRPPKGHDYSVASYRTVSPGYFETLQIPLIQGRFVQPGDRETAPPVVVINATMARTFFPNINPVGQHIQLGGLPNDTAPWMEIVGIVGDVKQALSSEAASEMYVPYRQADKTVPVLAMSLVLRTASDPRALAASVRSVVHDLDPNQPVVKIRTMDENVSDSISQPRFRTVLLAIFAGLALVLSSIGIFSVMAYSVAQRTRELGVRMALGASRGRILQLVLLHGLRLTIIGLVIGLAATFVFTKYVSSLLFSVRAYDPITLAAMAAVVIVVSLVACYVPARRATRLDPIVVLRHD